MGKGGTNVLISYPDVSVCTHIHVRAWPYMIHVHIYTSRRFIAAETEELCTWPFDPREYYRGLSYRDMFTSLSLSLSFFFLSFSSVSSGFYRFVVFSLFYRIFFPHWDIKLSFRRRLSAERILINRAFMISFQVIEIVFLPRIKIWNQLILWRDSDF